MGGHRGKGKGGEGDPMFSVHVSAVDTSFGCTHFRPAHVPLNDPNGVRCERGVDNDVHDDSPVVHFQRAEALVLRDGLWVALVTCSHEKLLSNLTDQISRVG
eukprot:29412-Amorphochlora_amoeboformis.AAC.1